MERHETNGTLSFYEKATALVNEYIDQIDELPLREKMLLSSMAGGIILIDNSSDEELNALLEADGVNATFDEARTIMERVISDFEIKPD